MEILKRFITLAEERNEVEHTKPMRCILFLMGMRKKTANRHREPQLSFKDISHGIAINLHTCFMSIAEEVVGASNRKERMI
jgi:hypothetical protein